VSLIELFGPERAFDEPLWCIERAATQLIGDLLPKP
jgi:hypothetical protein